MADEVSPQVAAPVPAKSEGKSIWLVVITVIIVILVILAGGFFFFTKMKSSPSGAPTANQPTIPTSSPTQAVMTESKYTCQDKKTMDVKYDNVARSASITLSDGRTMTLAQIPSGSGTKYSNSDGTVVLATEGGSAFLTENGKQTYQACSSGS